MKLRLRYLAIGAVALTAAFAAWVLRDASRALRESEASVAAESEIRFRELAVAPASIAFHPLGTPPGFAAALADGARLYVTGAAGLFVYDAGGHQISAYRTGLELPPAPLGAIAKARDILIATSGAGLLVLHDDSFRQVLPENPACRKITSLLPLASGPVLLGTSKCGVLSYDGRRIGIHHPSLQSAPVTALAGTEEDLWIGTQDRGVLHWHGGQLSQPEGLPDAQVLSLAAESGKVYAGTPLGVAEFVDGRLTRRLAEGFFAQSLLLDKGILAVGSLEEGVAVVPLQPGARLRRGIDIDGRVNGLLKIGGRLAALTGSGIYAPEPLIARPADLLANGNISALAADSAGRLWVGYFDRGLDILEPDLSRAAHVENDNVFCVNRIVHSQERGTAVATANGLVLFDGAGRIRRVLGRADGLLADHVNDVLFEPDAMIAATPAGITIVEESGARSLYAFQGLVNNHVYALGAASGRLLAGTLGGLSVIEAGIVKANFTTSNSGLKHNWISALVSVNDEWFAGTYGAGVMKFDRNGHWEPLTQPFEVNPLAMLATESRVYAGTLDRGLQVYDRARSRWTGIMRGLPSLNVTALAESNGQLYIGTDNGVVRVAEQDLLR
jgi:ligand-binding sensor domain-containing protein